MNANIKVCALIVLTLSLTLLLTTAWADETDLIWSTFLGGSGWDPCYPIAVDNSGNSYATGYTDSENFPTTAGAYDRTLNGLDDVFVAKLNPTGSVLVYSTLLGGTDSDRGMHIAVDGSGNAYMTGYTESIDFPVTILAFDITYNGGGDVFVAKLNSTGGILDYCTFLGGSSDSYELSRCIAVDSWGNAYVTGYTESSDFPTTVGAFDSTYNGGGDVFVVKFNPTGDALDYATFLGGNSSDGGWGISVDDSGRASVTGWVESSDFPVTFGAYDITYNGNGDVFVARMNPMGSALDYATFLGGSEGDEGIDIAADGSGNTYVTGHTASSDFPATEGTYDTSHNGSYDVFVTRINPAGNTLDYATFLGGDSFDGWRPTIAVDGSGNVCVTGYTESSTFPATKGAFDITYNGGGDVFVATFNPTGSNLDYSTFLGGGALELPGGIAVDDSGKAYVSGSTESADFPVTAGAFDITYNGGGDAFVAKFNLGEMVPVESKAPIVGLPNSYALRQNYPNPFNANTEIRYQITQGGHVILRVFNTLGQEVRTLVNGSQEAGRYAMSWDGRDNDGWEVSTGMYFCRLQADDFSKTIKMVLIQ